MENGDENKAWPPAIRIRGAREHENETNSGMQIYPNNIIPERSFVAKWGIRKNNFVFRFSLFFHNFLDTNEVILFSLQKPVLN